MKKRIFRTLCFLAVAVFLVSSAVLTLAVYLFTENTEGVRFSDFLSFCALPLSVSLALVVLIAALLSKRFSRDILEPLYKIDLNDPLKSNCYSELEPLLKKVDLQKRQLNRQAQKLLREQNQFETVTAGMSEGLILLNQNGTILSINRAARKILNITKASIGHGLFTVSPDFDAKQTTQNALSGIAGEKTVERDTKEYQVNATPVITDGQITGAVLLIFDISEKTQAEKMRREFTANVSHELKTPLHSISGYAELLKNGMVKSSDAAEFYEKIYSQSQRMITLVDDIIKLSKLDEGISTEQFESIDLNSVILDAVFSLSAAASRAKVSVNYESTHSVIFGVKQLVFGIVYNLLDNAIKYNRSGGSVNISVLKQQENVVLTVADTGIGIKTEHLSRIFERFYRVDKSHSKQVGGTGLGLSIVKHAAKTLKATVDVKSVIDKGTTITVTFKKN